MINKDIEVTEEYLLKHSTNKIGWTKKQLAVLGVDWPPQKGWKKMVYGKILNPDQQYKFETNNKVIKKNPSDKQLMAAIKTVEAAGYLVVDKPKSKVFNYPENEYQKRLKREALIK